MRMLTAAGVGMGLWVMAGCSMNEQEIDRLTRQWILVWNDGDPATLPLADDFQHTSPYGRIEGREHYLEVVVPMAKENVSTLTIEDVLVSGSQSVIRYQVAKPGGETMKACDWLTFENGQLARVWSYYERPQESRADSY